MAVGGDDAPFATRRVLPLRGGVDRGRGVRAAARALRARGGARSGTPDRRVVGAWVRGWICYSVKSVFFGAILKGTFRNRHLQFAVSVCNVRLHV